MYKGNIDYMSYMFKMTQWSTFLRLHNVKKAIIIIVTDVELRCYSLGAVISFNNV